MRHSLTSFCLNLLLLSTTSALAQTDNRPVNLLSNFSPTTSPQTGTWSITPDGLRVEKGKGCRTLLAERLPRTYELQVEFTRVSGNDVVAVILPIGKTSVALELSSWGGEAHGIARVDEQSSRSASNPTSVRPGKLTNGRRYTLDVRVAADDENCQVTAQLDGTRLIDWKGSTTRLLPHLAFNFPDRNALGLASQQNDVIFHQVELRSADGMTGLSKAESPVRPTGTLFRLDDLTKPGTRGWQPFNGAKFISTTSQTPVIVSSVPDSGAGDRGAFVSDLQFTDGTIEVDIRGDAQPQQSFAGVVFGAIDSQNYESVYFRSFNFRSTDEERRSHAVQYIAHPEWPWKRLRAERAGQFESAVRPEPEPEEWFHARIQIAGDTVSVFVNESEQPSLQVKRLVTSRSGKVGLWFNGIASFRNLTVTPAADD